VADSNTTTFRHNFGLNSADLEFFLYTGTGTSKVFVNPVVAGYVIVDNGANPKLEIDVTAPSSGGPHDYTLVVSWSAVGGGTATDVGSGASTVVATAGADLLEGQAVFGADDGGGGLEVYPFDYLSPKSSRQDFNYVDKTGIFSLSTMNGSMSAYSQVQDYNINIVTGATTGTNAWYVLNRLSVDAATGETKVTKISDDIQYITGAFSYPSFCTNTDGSEILHLYVDNATGDGSAQVVTPGADTLTFETPFAWETSGTITAYHCVYDPVNSSYGVFWTEGAAGSNIFSRQLKVTGTTVSSPAARAFSFEVGRANPRVAWSTTQGKFFVFYYDGTAANEIQYWRYAVTDGNQVTSYETEQSATGLFETEAISGEEWAAHTIVSFDDNTALVTGAGQEAHTRAVAVFDMGAATPALTFVSKFGDDTLFDLVKSPTRSDAVYAILNPPDSGLTASLETLIVDPATKTFSRSQAPASIFEIVNDVVFMKTPSLFGLFSQAGNVDRDFSVEGLNEYTDFQRNKFIGLVGADTAATNSVEIFLNGANFDASSLTSAAGNTAYIGQNGVVTGIKRVGDYRIGDYLESDTVRIDNKAGHPVAAAGWDIEKGDILYGTRSPGNREVGDINSGGDLAARPLEYMTASVSDASLDYTAASGTANPQQISRGKAYDSTQKYHVSVWQDLTSWEVRYISSVLENDFDTGQPMVKVIQPSTVIHTGTAAESPTICSSSDNTEHLLVYVDGGDGKAEVITMGPDGVLSFGTTFTWETSSDVNSYSCAYESEFGSYAIFYTEDAAGAGSTLFSRVLTVSGTTITAPNPRVAEAGGGRWLPTIIWDKLTEKYYVLHTNTTGLSILAITADSDGTQIVSSQSAATPSSVQFPPIGDGIASSQKYVDILHGDPDEGWHIILAPSTNGSPADHTTDPLLFTLQMDPDSVTFVDSVSSQGLVCEDSSYPLSAVYVHRAQILAIACEDTILDAADPYMIKSFFYDINQSAHEQLRDFAPFPNIVTNTPSGGATLFYDEHTDGFALSYHTASNVFIDPAYLGAEIAAARTFPTSGRTETRFLGIALEDAARSTNVSYVPNNGFFTDVSVPGIPGELAFIGRDRKVSGSGHGPRLGIFHSPNTVQIRKDPTKIALQYTMSANQAHPSGASKLDFDTVLYDNTYGDHFITSGADEGTFVAPRYGTYEITAQAVIDWAATPPINSSAYFQAVVNDVQGVRTLTTYYQEFIDGAGSDSFTVNIAGLIELQKGETVSIYWENGVAADIQTNLQSTENFFYVREL
jgi:hypothetical protein